MLLELAWSSRSGTYRSSYAPVWTDSAARAVLEQLKADMAAWHTKKVGDYCLKVLSSDQDTASLLERTSRKLSLHDRGIAKAIVNAHSAAALRLIFCHLSEQPAPPSQPPQLLAPSSLMAGAGAPPPHPAAAPPAGSSSHETDGDLPSVSALQPTGCSAAGAGAPRCFLGGAGFIGS